MEISKINVKLFFKIFISLLILVGAFNYMVDPYQFYNRSKILKPIYKDAVAMSPGMIKNYNYNCAVIGSSHSQNFLISDLNVYLGKKCIKNTLGGLSSYEINKIFDLHLEVNKANYFLLNIDFFSFRGEANRVRSNFINYLYDVDLFSHFKYLINFDVSLRSSRMVANFIQKKNLRSTDVNSSFSWYYGKEFSKDNVMKSYEIGIQEKFDSESYALTRLKENFRINVLSKMVKSNEKEFVLFFPPYSIMHWKLISEQGWLSEALLFRSYIYSSIEKLDNVKLYDFQSLNVISDLGRYRDTSHYDKEINKLMLKEISAGRYLKDGSELLLNNKKILGLIELL